MKVRELIEKLKHCDQNEEVFVAYPSGDYWHTQLAGAPSKVKTLPVKYSDYHSQYALVETPEDRYDYREIKDAVVITLK